MPEEADFTEAVEDVVNRVLSDVSTSFPAIIVPPSAKEGLVDVQPAYKFKVPGDQREHRPKIINNVPLLLPHRTLSTIIRPPKEALIGAKVLCITCEHDITAWRSSGEAVFPDESRQFDANDCVAIAGLFSDIEVWPTPQLPFTFEIAGIEGTKFKIGTQTADLVGLTYQILNLMSAGVDPVVANPTHGQFINLAQIQALLIRLLTIANPVL